ncbi:carbon monoxide dehydrogenase subunit G [Actinomadura sp. SCN-SB]|uniref:SRPBCC family protein n=1 Tax=Actinomadura sp. SCN-SB TaxID=3373092 RepID=UPI003752C4E9
MKVTGSATIAAPPPRVWDALQDPAVLARTIPGCHSLEATGRDAYRMTVSAGVASIKGTYVGSVELAEPDPPRSFVLRARGRGAPGTVDATVRVRLSAAEDGTRVDYDADAVVGGMIGGVGQRMLGSVARKTAGEFFAAVERSLTAAGMIAEEAGAEIVRMPARARAGGGEAPPIGEPVEPPRPGAVYMGEPRAARPVPTLSAFASGGAVALAGVVIGYVLGRRSTLRKAARP